MKENAGRYVGDGGANGKKKEKKIKLKSTMQRCEFGREADRLLTHSSLR